ncbi:unnamed protein product [Adineta ricciae]|uniref:[histone H3]-lysine(27) N-trimethyltransferase n=1 Tax=Adineta ricciae TaxID=249248 RepID=A0A816A0D8_ADIRI|nr:unnamed protein product [Adineta ricciae]CAF1591678.1 unnamed protein product [Adineta ricciae]
MREKKRSDEYDQREISVDKEADVLRQAVESEYTTLYRQIHKTAQKTARRILRHVVQPSAPQALTISIPTLTNELNSDTDDNDITVSVTVADGTNKNPHKDSTIPIVMPTLPVVRELISYVPTTRNLATRGHLIGIPYLGDKFDAEDQRLINSISIEPSKSQKLTRKKKLDEQSLEALYRSLRSNHLWINCSNEQLIDAILYYHRDSTPRAKLLALAHENDCYLNEKQQNHTNIDQDDTLDMDIDELVIKPWCSRFCPRCYTYNCLLHKEGPTHLPLPKKFSLTFDNQTESCGSTCYKLQRDHLKRPLSPSTSPTESTTSPDNNNRKRQRRSSSNQTSVMSDENLHNENPLDINVRSTDVQKRISSHYLTRIENQMDNQLLPAISVENNWTLTDQSLFRLFYFLFDGDLCSLKYMFQSNHTCQQLYEEFIRDSKYFSERISSTDGSPCLIRRPYRRRMPEGTTRAFLLYIKRTLNRPNDNHNQKNTATTLKPSYQPCLHDGPCTVDNPQCCCMKMGTFCEKFCNCASDCPHRFPGCACKGSCLFNSCLCSAEGRECDPDLCHNCGASLFFDLLSPPIKQETGASPSVSETTEEKSFSKASVRNVRSRTLCNLPARSQTLRSCRNNETTYRTISKQRRRANSRASLNSLPTPSLPAISCANISLQRKVHKQILVAESDIAGYGAFLGSPVAYPGELIAEYTGEIISEEEADRRGRLYDKRACSYLFNLDMQHCIDARQFGNKLRFANHSSKPNCVPKIKLVNGNSYSSAENMFCKSSFPGDYRIGIYAKEVIFQGDELFFEYMYDAHQRQQFINNERVDEAEQENVTVLTRYADNFMLVQPSID